MLIKFEVKIELPIIQLGSLFERLEQVMQALLLRQIQTALLSPTRFSMPCSCSFFNCHFTPSDEMPHASANLVLLTAGSFLIASNIL